MEKGRDLRGCKFSILQATQTSKISTPVGCDQLHYITANIFLQRDNLVKNTSRWQRNGQRGLKMVV